MAVIGSGHAAYGVCQVLAKDPRIEIDVFDIGLTGSYPNQHENPVSNGKSVNGSWFPYGLNDSRWPVSLKSDRICSSHAYGGFGNVYSGAVLVPHHADLKGWPEDSIPTPEDYSAIKKDFEILDAADALMKWPAFEPAVPASESRGISSVWGFSRIAVQRSKTAELRPFNPAYSFDQLRIADRIRYVSECYILSLENHDSGIKLMTATEKSSKTYSGYDAIFLGAGCINTTGIVHRSFRRGEIGKYRVQNATAFVQGFMGRGPELSTALLKRRENSLPEIFLELRSEDYFDGHWCHTQISAVNKHVLETIAERFPKSIMQGLGKFIDQIHLAISTVPSYLNNQEAIFCVVTEKRTQSLLGSSIEIYEPPPHYDKNWRRTIREAIAYYKTDLRLAHVPCSEKLVDLLRGNRLGGWHFGGTIPMCADATVSEGLPLSCTPQGELRQSPGVFLVDSASFPSVPGTTVALLTMAHAARVGRGWLESE